MYLRKLDTWYVVNNSPPKRPKCITNTIFQVLSRSPESRSTNSIVTIHESIRFTSIFWSMKTQFVT